MWTSMKETVDQLLSKTFIKLRTDFGFKKVFASPEHAEILKRFLNALFDGSMVVTDIAFHDKEVLPPDKDGKRIVYDVYCTTSTGYHFVVEMQQEQSELFGKRMLFYISSCIFRQGETGGSYRLNPVYLIVITDFDMRPFERRLVNEIVLMERDTHVVFTEDFKMFFLSLEQVSVEWDDCKSEIERLLYLIKNMENLNKKSKPYLSGEYDEIFNASEIASMVNEELVAYKNSLRMDMERQSALEFAKEEGREEGWTAGREEGKEEGRMEGIEAGKMEVAREMKKKGMRLGDILLFTGLSEQQIDSL